jgi:plasmid maintenance system antidote protein VapI
MNETLPNIHPGEVLLEEFMKPLELSQNRLAHCEARKRLADRLETEVVPRTAA